MKRSRGGIQHRGLRDMHATSVLLSLSSPSVICLTTVTGVTVSQGCDQLLRKLQKKKKNVIWKYKTVVIHNCHNHEWIISCGNLQLAMASLSGKESTCQCRRCGFDPWLGKIPWRRTRQSTPVFLLGKSHAIAAWQATAHGIAKSWTWLSDWTTTAWHA